MHVYTQHIHTCIRMYIHTYVHTYIVNTLNLCAYRHTHVKYIRANHRVVMFAARRQYFRARMMLSYVSYQQRYQHSREGEAMRMTMPFIHPIRSAAGSCGHTSRLSQAGILRSDPEEEKRIDTLTEPHRSEAESIQYYIYIHIDVLL